MAGFDNDSDNEKYFIVIVNSIHPMVFSHGIIKMWIKNLYVKII